MSDLGIAAGRRPATPANRSSSGGELPTDRGRDRARNRLGETLSRASADLRAASEVALTFGFDLDETFTAVALRTTDQQNEHPSRIEALLDGVQGISVLLGGQPEGRYLILAQGVMPRQLAETIRSAVSDFAIGVGLPRPGIAGAQATIQDALRCADIASPGTTIYFESDWLTATTMAEPDRFIPLFARGLEVAEKNAHLIETLRAYLELDRSKVRTAERLFIHAHTVVYRLERWKALTGWDVSTSDGLLMTLTTVRLFDALGTLATGDAGVVRLP